MTNPIREILPRESDPKVDQLLIKFSNLIDEFVNFGTQIFKWTIEESKGTDEQMPLLMFFRDMLEKADAISILVRNSSIDPSKVLLRSIFELNLYIGYLLEKNTEDRAMAFLVLDALRQKQMNINFNKEGPEFKRIRKLLEQDILISDPNFLDNLPSVKHKIELLNSLLNRDEYKRVMKEYERTKKIDNCNPAWYRLYNGPKTIQALAIYLKLPFLYEILYRRWSGSVHSSDIIHGKIIKKESLPKLNGKVNTEIVQIRLPKDAQEVTSNLLNLLLHTYIILRNSKIPKRTSEIQKWYLSVKDQIRQVIKKERLIKIEF